ncbi:hypothetical protein BDB00DRAFT_928441 [Zychaea mexicana]|uniref:uncharacterized protein n=1 Tax=Zychaea mexicana TaxID=64656 RepID=UPI0022FE0953|nr:uncharacterized protein BDB00DRAFT_928441 [Zychaea mexicana]KAI9494157.1 hypothetical protein BDB00DRAFT_928441 [Zychaea mexicana]
MPLKALSRFQKRLSAAYCYPYGKALASRPVSYLLLSFLCVSLLSYSVILHAVNSFGFNPNAVDSIDAHFWQYSPHVKLENCSTTTTTTTSAAANALSKSGNGGTTSSPSASPPRLIAQQIRLSNHDNAIDNELLHHARTLQNVLTTSVVYIDRKPVSLATICLTRRGQCVIHSPLEYFKNNNNNNNNNNDMFGDNWIETVQQHRAYADESTGLSMHPLSVFGNATLDPFGRFLTADSIIFTVLLQSNHYTQRVWNELWEHTTQQLRMGHLDSVTAANRHHHHHPSWSNDDGEEDQQYRAWQKQLPMMHALTVQYQLKLFPQYLPAEMYVCAFVFVALSFAVSNAIGNAHLLRSQFGLGLAAVFMALACFTTTVGILNYFHLWRHMVTPWYLLILVSAVASLENTFLLTNAVVNAGCDMQIREKIGRGLESVMVPMTATLAAELAILAIGDAMHNPLVSDFCLFARVALLVGYVLEMTFFMAVLAINVKCVELTDLDDRQTSKRLRELAKYNVDADTAPDLCPIQEPINECTEAKSCAECKQFKTHRTLNALVLCLIILTLFRASSWSSYSVASSAVQHQQQQEHHNSEYQHHRYNEQVDSFAESVTSNDDLINYELISTSTRFWSTVNPFHDSMQLQVNPPYLVLYTPTAADGLAQALHLEEYYASKSILYQQQQQQQQQLQHQNMDETIRRRYVTSRFRKFLFDTVKRVATLIFSINVPSIMLCVVLVGIIIWLTPSWREAWLRPLLKWLFLESVSYCAFLIRRMLLQIPGSTGRRIARELGDYDENGVHRGAILAQQQFNKQQLEHNIRQVDIKTLSGKHVADVRRLAVNAKHGSLVSCGQDGRIILWDAQDGEWMARLDRVRQTHSGVMKGDLNPTYWQRPNMKKRGAFATPSTTTAAAAAAAAAATLASRSKATKQMVSARCVKIDHGNKWIASGFDDGMIRVWDMQTGNLLRELHVETEIPITVEAEDEERQHYKTIDLSTIAGLKNRHHRPKKTAAATSALSSSSQQKQRHHVTDRVIAIQFVGAVVEYCHPIVAEAAAKQAMGDDNSTQNYLVSVHKSGIIREWDVPSGECIKSIPSEHNKDITLLHVVECKAPHPKLGVTWIFTASKDGTVKCWERRLDKEAGSTVWTCAYTLDAHHGHPITALATELPVGGMGALVTGSSDGAVKVWNFETGEAVCTLSTGGFVKQRSKQAPMVGGPLLKYSRIPSDDDVHHGATRRRRRRHTDDTSSYASMFADISDADHRGPITQVVVARYCEVENGPGLCRGCDTCFGNGFLVASSSSDESVHVWRLERADGKHEGSCTLCTKDYHQKRYPTRSRNNNDDNKRPRRMSSPRRRVYRHPPRSATHTTSASIPPSVSIAETMELLDIEQLGGEMNIDLAPTFLGTIEQLAGRGLVFCNNMILGGVRKNKSGEWEAWFASLKYYDPSEQHEDDDDQEEDPVMIPVETFDLEETTNGRGEQPEEAAAAGAASTHVDHKSILASLWHFVVGSSDDPSAKGRRIATGRARNGSTSDTKGSDDGNNDEKSDDDDEYDEASEMLPFSTVRHVIPLHGSGLACDFGNFIKVVYVDDRCQKHNFHAVSATNTVTSANTTIAAATITTTTTTTATTATSLNKKTNRLTQEKKSSSSSGCCGGSGKNKNSGQCCGGSSSSSSNDNQKSNSQCCGGKNNGKCCGGKGFVRRRPPVVNSTTATTTATTTTSTTSTTSTTASSSCNIAECSSQANCPRASECQLAATRSYGH